MIALHLDLLIANFTFRRYLKIMNTISNNQSYNFIIGQFRKYNIGLISERETLLILNMLEAHGETFEDIGDWNSYVYELGAESRAEAIHLLNESNIFYESKEHYIERMLINGYSIEEAEAIFEKDIVKTTDGYVAPVEI